ncbi:MAG: hypothetical protein PVI26_02825 [Chitinispirillia bacterium]
METRVLDKNLRYHWEKYLKTNPFSISWQGFDWKDILRKHYKFKFFPIAAFDNLKICGILPLYLIETTNGKRMLISVPYAAAGGIIADNDEIRSILLEKAIDLYKHHNAQKLVLKQYKFKLPGELGVEQSYYSCELPLEKNLDILWNSISEDNRKKIQETEQFNIFLDYPSKNIDLFYSLLLRFHHKSGIPCVNKRWIKNLVQSGNYKIALMYSNHKPVAGTMVNEFKNAISFPFSCLVKHNSFYMLYMYRLYWDLITHYAGLNFTHFHSGRIPLSNETYQYRLGWGGKKNRYYYQYYPNTNNFSDINQIFNKKRKVFENIWKMTPQPITSVIGPYIVKRFP